MNAFQGTGGMPPGIFNFGSRSGSVIEKIHQYPLHRDCWAQRHSGSFRRKDKPLAPVRNRSTIPSLSAP